VVSPQPVVETLDPDIYTESTWTRIWSWYSDMTSILHQSLNLLVDTDNDVICTHTHRKDVITI